MTLSTERHVKVSSDPRYIALVRRRSRFAWSLTAVMLCLYFGYILLVAFRRDLLARPIGDSMISLGIPVGIGVILAGVLLTAVYVRRANRDFDPKLQAIRQEYEQ